MLVIISQTLPLVPKESIINILWRGELHVIFTQRHNVNQVFLSEDIITKSVFFAYLLLYLAFTTCGYCRQMHVQLFIHFQQQKKCNLCKKFCSELQTNDTFHYPLHV